MSSRLILIVDDDAEVRDAIKDILEDEGHRVLLAVHGAEALAHLRNGARPDLIVVDHMMPVMDGPTFAAEVGRDPALKDLRMVLVTADGRAQAKASAMGLDRYLHKPLKVEALLEVVDES